MTNVQTVLRKNIRSLQPFVPQTIVLKSPVPISEMYPINLKPIKRNHTKQMTTANETFLFIVLIVYSLYKRLTFYHNNPSINQIIPNCAIIDLLR